MSHGEQLLQQILENPSDLDSRLVYADWLMENGNPRGELIQIQFEIANGCTGKRLSTLRKKEKSLIKQFVTEETFGLVRKPEYRLGFIEHATVALKTFIDQSEEICSKMPLRDVCLSAGRNRIPQLVKCKSLMQFEVIEFLERGFDDTDLKMLADCEYLSNLQRLRFRCPEFGDDGVKALAESNHFTNLRYFGSSRIRGWTDNCMKTICESKNLSQLESLELTDATSLKATGMTHISNSTFRENLNFVELFYSPIGVKGVENLFHSKQPFPRLEKLLLNGCRLGPTTIKALEKNRELLPNLKVLGLNFNDIGCKGAIELANSKILSQLTDVRMSQNEIGFDGIKALGESEFRKRSTKFYLAKNFLDDGEITKITEQFGNFGKFDA